MFHIPVRERGILNFGKQFDVKGNQTWIRTSSYSTVRLQDHHCSQGHDGKFSKNVLDTRVPYVKNDVGGSCLSFFITITP